jgi:hypothetical protein
MLLVQSDDKMQRSDDLWVSGEQINATFLLIGV